MRQNSKASAMPDIITRMRSAEAASSSASR